MDEDQLDSAALAKALEILAAAVMVSLPKARASRLLVALSIAPERLQRGSAREVAAIRRARRWWSRVLPAILRAVR